MRLSPRQRLGQQGENRALEYLTEQGLKLIERNYRCRLGELDLIMRDGECVVIVEVRQRTRGDYGGALASISPAKQRRIIQAARHLLMIKPALAEAPVRFDVVGIDPQGRTRWIRDAFQAS